MAVWIAQVTLEANAFKLHDVIRDSMAERVSRKKCITCKRRRVQEPEPCPAERLLKAPRLAALRERVLARLAQPVHEAGGR